MTALSGQAAGEYAGLLGLAAVLGAGLALLAGPPLVETVRNALARGLSGDVRRQASPIASAADIADVQSALLPTPETLTPDAVLLSLARRHGTAQAVTVADALVLDAARGAAPWIGTTRTYRAWTRPGDNPYDPAVAGGTGDRDVERVTGRPVVSWVTVAEQRRTLAAAVAHHTSPSAVGLDLAGLVPLAKPFAEGVRGVGAFAKVALEDLPDSIELLHHGAHIAELMHSDGHDVPPGMRAGDVVIAWPVQRTFWRGGRSDREAPVNYEHRLVLRPGAQGLRVIAEEVAS